MSRSRRQRDKSMSSFGSKEELSGRMIHSRGIGNDFTDGHRGMAHAVKGAKKYVNSRRRFWEKMAISKGLHEE